MLPLTEDGEYFYFGGEIYSVSRQQSECLKPFYLAMMYQKGRKLRFIEEDKLRFVSEILPFAEKAGNLVISEQVQSVIEKLPLEAEVCLDREDAKITAEVRFIYGERVINPFLPHIRTADTPGKLIIRDINSEETILDILAMSDFKVKEGRIHLSGDENIYDFLFRLVPLLQDHASVFYSESLKNVQLRMSVPFTARFGINTETGMLEFAFDAEGIDRSELADIFASLRMKKKYYLLKNGNLINLDSYEFTRLYEIIGKLNVKPEQLINEHVEIPHFRAVYLDQVIRDSDVHNIERNTAFKEFVQNIREPGDMAFHVPSGLRGSLRDYQKLGFKWLKTLSHYKLGGILADDMEEKILSLQEKKRRLTDAVIRPGETFISKMTMDEIQALFE